MKLWGIHHGEYLGEMACSIAFSSYTQFGYPTMYQSKHYNKAIKTKQTAPHRIRPSRKKIASEHFTRAIHNSIAQDHRARPSLDDIA